MAKIIATTVVGLEPDAAADLRESFGLAATASSDGAVEIEVGPELRAALEGPELAEAIVELNQCARCVHRVGVLLAAADVESLDDCYAIAREVDYAPLVTATAPFAVRPRRSGVHEFGSPDIGRVVGQAVIDAYRAATGARLRVDLERPSFLLRAELHDYRFRLWLDATGDVPLTYRSYRQQLHPASLRPSLAHLLLRIAGWTRGPLLDPMCGIGTILIEAAGWMSGIPPFRYRDRGWAHERFSWVTRHRTASRRVVPAGAGTPTSGGEAAEILGIERSARHVQGARLNVAAAGLSERVRIVNGDATRLEEYVGETGAFPLAVLNPPFGRRVGSHAKVERLYAEFGRSARRAGIRRIVTLVELLPLMQRALEGAGYRASRRLPLVHGRLEVTAVVAEAG